MIKRRSTANPASYIVQFCTEVARQGPMKMGTNASPWRYDAAAADAIRPDNQRRNAISAPRGRLSSRFRGLVRLPFGCHHFDQSRERRDGPEAAHT
jgi:hypothetical protein